MFNAKFLIVSIRKKAQEMAVAMTLTSDDSRAFEIRGSFGQQVEPAIGHVLCLVEHKVRDIDTVRGEMSVTDLFFQRETVEDGEYAPKMKSTPAFDLQNIFLSDDPTVSLKKLGEGTDGSDVMSKLACFTVDRVVPTGIYPMKKSKASELLKFSDGHKYTDSERATLRAKYLEDDVMKGPRTDVPDLEWYEIRHVFISVVS